METVSFKIPTEMVDALTALARASNERSHNTFARTIVMDFLAGRLAPSASPTPASTASGHDTAQENRVLAEALTEIFQQVLGLREDLANSMVVLLQHAGQVKDSTEAEHWVRRTLMDRFKGKYGVCEG